MGEGPALRFRDRPLSFGTGRGLAEAHTRATPVFGNEIHTAGLEAPLHHVERGATRSMTAGLELANGHHTDAGLFRKFLLAPIQESSSCATLGR